MTVYKPGQMWCLRPFKEFPVIFFNTPPNWFHRFMQRVFFGFRWYRE